MPRRVFGLLLTTISMRADMAGEWMPRIVAGDYQRTPQDSSKATIAPKVEKAEAELAEAQRAAAGEYLQLESDARRTQERIGRYEAAVLKPLQQRTEATLAAYRSNAATLVVLFEARHAEVEAQRKLLALQRDLAKALAQLVFKPVFQGAAQ